jgi:hypothetical protein
MKPAGDADSMRDSTSDPSLSAIEVKLRRHADSLSPDDAQVARMRARARARYVAAFSDADRPAFPMGPATFLGKRVPLALLAAMLLTAAFGDITLCEGMSTLGFGTYLVAGQLPLSPFTAIGASMLVVGAVELFLAFGIWARRDWASPLAAGIQTVAIACSLGWIVSGAQPQLQILNIMVAIVVIALLRPPEIRAALVGRSALPA